MNISRRRFLQSGAGALGVCLGWNHLAGLAAYSAQVAPRKIGSRILIVVQLAGGNDGINTVIPFSSPAYYKARPGIAIKAEQVLAVNSEVGLHPSMTAMSDLYKNGKVAIILGAGYPSPNRSHFRSIEIWQTAEPERIGDTGWLGRYLDTCADCSSHGKQLLPAVNVDSILPKTLSAERVIVPSVANVNQFRFSTDSHFQQDKKFQIESFNRIYSGFDLDRPGVKLLKDVGLDAMQASDYLFEAVRNYKDEVAYPDNGFAKGLKFIAQMICAGVDATIYNISLGGFDTHTNQLGSHANLLKQLSEGVTAFQKDMEQHHLDDDVVLMTFSEFGRRVAQNNSGGTDHGTAEPLFVVGSSVKGGVYGEYPSLTTLDNGDLKYTIDFRSVYGTMLNQWFRADSSEILGGRFEYVPFIRNV